MLIQLIQLVFDTALSWQSADLSKMAAEEIQVADLSNSPNLSNITIEKPEEGAAQEVPLQTPWTFWIDKTKRGTSAAQYEAQIKPIYTVDTVQRFWAVFHHIPPPSKSPVHVTYHLMRNDIRPFWEDPPNQRGGTWRFKCHKNDTEHVWRELLLAVIGEQLSELLASGDEIYGVSVSIREKNDLVQIWNASSFHHDKSTLMEHIKKQLLPDVNFLVQFYKTHETHHAFEGERKKSK